MSSIVDTLRSMYGDKFAATIVSVPYLLEREGSIAACALDYEAGRLVDVGRRWAEAGRDEALRRLRGELRLAAAALEYWTRSQAVGSPLQLKPKLTRESGLSVVIVFSDASRSRVREMLFTLRRLAVVVETEEGALRRVGINDVYAKVNRSYAAIAILDQIGNPVFFRHGTSKRSTYAEIVWAARCWFSEVYNGVHAGGGSYYMATSTSFLSLDSCYADIRDPALYAGGGQ